MRANSDYLTRFPGGWIEQAQGAAGQFAAACKEASTHNDDSDNIDTLQVGFHELVAELWNLGFKPSEIKAALQRIEDDRYISGSED